jgi:uncharacterized protein YacL (UPF0231 family)
MLTTVAKRIQTSLKRKGVVATSGDIKDYLRANVGNIENITKEEENNATQYFLSTATKLTVVSDDVPTEDLTEVEETNSSAGGELGNIAEPTQMELETLTSEDVDIVNTVDNAINTTSIQDIDSIDLHINEAALDTEEETALATATKSELVASTAGELGIVLDAQEISLIAENISYSTDTLEQDIDAIESAIMAFVEHKAAISQQKINNMITSVRNVVTEKNSENSQLLTNGLRSINSDIQEANKDFKSQVKTALTAFKLPSLKAG